MKQLCAAGACVLMKWNRREENGKHYPLFFINVFFDDSVNGQISTFYDHLEEKAVL